jgi:hypothetical protein
MHRLDSDLLPVTKTLHPFELMGRYDLDSRMHFYLGIQRVQE